jgi:hypothetical protein
MGPRSWLSQFAEECAELAKQRAAAALSKRIRQEAAAHGFTPAQMTNLVAQEWERLGILRVPMPFGVDRV